MNIWRNLATTDIQRLYKNPKYPDNPDEQRTLSTFDYNNIGNYYGGRISALYQVQQGSVVRSPFSLNGGIVSI